MWPSPGKIPEALCLPPVQVDTVHFSSEATETNGFSRLSSSLNRTAVSSDINSFGYGKSIMDLDAKIADRALNPLVPQQKLYCSQVAGPAVDEGGSGSAQ
jgi:hypothetical protein